MKIEHHFQIDTHQQNSIMKNRIFGAIITIQYLYGKRDPLQFFTLQRSFIIYFTARIQS